MSLHADRGDKIPRKYEQITTAPKQANSQIHNIHKNRFLDYL
jgi:hypothetical protein